MIVISLSICVGIGIGESRKSPQRPLAAWLDPPPFAFPSMERDETPAAANLSGAAGANGGGQLGAHTRWRERGRAAPGTAS